MQRQKIPIDDEDDSSIVKNGINHLHEEVKESESKMKLVNGDANENSIA